jgi:hypothetical protein
VVLKLVVQEAVMKEGDKVVLRGGHGAISFGFVTEMNVGRIVPSP